MCVCAGTHARMCVTKEEKRKVLVLAVRVSAFAASDMLLGTGHWVIASSITNLALVSLQRSKKGRK